MPKKLSSMYSIGIDIGGMSIKTGIIDDNGTIIISKNIPTEHQEGVAAMVARMAAVVAELCREVKVEYNAVRGIGVGVPGLTDTKTGIVTSAANIGWRNVNIVDEFRKYFVLPVRTSNDANCAALGEQRFGGGKEFSSIVLVTLGTGVGSGIVVEGKLFMGNGSAGAESGHLLYMPDGELCGCGRCGCWEAYASATALIKQTKKEMANSPFSKMHDVAVEQGKISGRTAFIAADMGDEAGKRVVDNYIRHIARGLISLGNVLHPEAFIIGGGISHEGDNLIEPLQKYLNNDIEKTGFYPYIKVKAANLGNNAGIIGAAALVME